MKSVAKQVAGMAGQLEQTSADVTKASSRAKQAPRFFPPRSRVLAFVLPVFAYFLTKSICQELRERELRPLREFSGVAETAPEREREPSV